MKTYLVIDQDHWDELNEVYHFTDEQNKFFLDIDEKTAKILMSSSDDDVLIEAAKEKIDAKDFAADELSQNEIKELFFEEVDDLDSDDIEYLSYMLSTGSFVALTSQGMNLKQLMALEKFIEQIKNI